MDMDRDDSVHAIHERVKKARIDNAYSASNVYDLVYMNSVITGLQVSKQTCLALLEQMESWSLLPQRVKNGLLEDTLTFMTEGKLPPYKVLWDKIYEHPVFVRFRSGEMPAVSVRESMQESDERQKKNSDIAQLRTKTAREAQLVTDLIKEYVKFEIEEAPTEPGEIPTVPLAKTKSRKVSGILTGEPKIPHAKWDESGSRYSLHTSKKRA